MKCYSLSFRFFCNSVSFWLGGHEAWSSWSVRIPKSDMRPAKCKGCVLMMSILKHTHQYHSCHLKTLFRQITGFAELSLSILYFDCCFNAAYAGHYFYFTVWINCWWAAIKQPIMTVAHPRVYRGPEGGNSLFFSLGFNSSFRFSRIIFWIVFCLKFQIAWSMSSPQLL